MYTETDNICVISVFHFVLSLLVPCSVLTEEMGCFTICSPYSFKIVTWDYNYYYGKIRTELGIEY